MKRKIIIFTVVFVLLIALAITIAGCSTSLSSVNGKYYEYENGQKVEDSYIELKAGKKWSDGEDSGEYTLDGNNITILLDGEELMSGTVKDGVLSLEFWGRTTVYYKDGAFGSESNNNDNSGDNGDNSGDNGDNSGDNGDNTGNGNTGNGDTPNTPAVPDEKAKIISIANGTVDGMTCNMEVNSSVSSVDLSGAVTVSEDSSWQLYADVLGQTNIPTKYAANLSNGDNVYYIVVNSADGTVNRTYTLHIWKNFEVEILFKVDGETVKTLTKQTHTYIPQSEFSAVEKEGYTFIEWSNYEGKDYYISGYAGETYFLDYQIIFEANFSANNYVITLDGNGGECNKKSKTVTYDQPFTLPVLSREGYTFRGWFYDYWNRLTLEDGESVADYNYDYDITATASWTVNSYLLTLSQEGNNGTISGGGQKDYGSRVTITAKANNGYTFDGWYNNGRKVSSDSTYTFTMPAYNVNYVAKWTYYTISTETNLEGAGTYTVKTDEKVTVGKTVELTATTNKGYTWLGWYQGDTKVSEDLTYTFTMSAYNVTYVAKWSLPAELENFECTISSNGVTITGVKNKNATNITIPDSVTSIDFSAFSGCSKLESITIPFVGAKAGVTSSDTYQYPFGYIFGTSSYTGGTAVEQSYYGSSTSSRTYETYYIPSSLRSVTVTGGNILYGAFYKCSSLTAITIPDSVTTIGDYAFAYCSSLTSIIIPDSVTTIGDYAFRYCYNLESVTLGENSQLTTIGKYAFYNCSNLTSVTIPDGVTSIGNYAFEDCTSLTSIDVDENNQNYKSIDGNLYSKDGSTLLQYAIGKTNTSFTIPDSVTSIGSYAFSSCSNLESVTIGENSKLTTIGEGAFYKCSSLITITIPDSVTTIGESTFYCCDSLTSITIPNSVTSIGDDAFYYCDSLTSITIPNSVTSIGEGAFHDCSNLTSVTIPDSVTSIGYGAFYFCDSLTIYCEAESQPEGWHASWNNYNRPVVWNVQSVLTQDGITYAITKANFATVVKYTGTATELTIPNTVTIDGTTYTVTSIGAEAFYNCDSLTSITILDSVTTIGSYAFSSCSNLTSIVVDENNQNYKSIDGNLYSKDGSTLIQYAIGKTDTTFTIPDSVTTIGQRAFAWCSKLTSITIPDTVASIGAEAFYNCDSLASITILDSVTSIGSYAFSSCSNLESVTIGENSKLTTIGEGAFYKCSSLITITIPDSVTSIGENTFSHCDILTSIIIPDSVTSIRIAAFLECSNLTIYCEAESKPSGWSSSWNFSNCPVVWNVQSVFAQDGITYAITKANFAAVGKYTGTATEVTIPGTVTIDGTTYTVTTIVGRAFRNCSNLTSITIPDSVTSIGSYAFRNCNSLTSIIIPDSVTTIGYRAFECCYSLTSITIPNSVTSIGELAFYLCDSLTSITIPDSVTSIGDDAFRGCDNLTIYCEAESKPSGWSSSWNDDNCPVVWGYKEE